MADTKQKRPFPVSVGFSDKIVNAARGLGPNIFGNMGKSGEYDVELVVICPPFIVTEIEIQTIVELLGEAIRRVGHDYIVGTLRTKASL